MLHSGHVAFFKEASAYGDLYVGIGSDATIEGLKGRKPVYSENERLYMVRAIRHVKEAYINSGSGMMDFVETVERVRPDVFVVNEDGDSEIKRDFCRERGIEYVVLDDGWSEAWDVTKTVPEINMEELVAYGKKKNVDLILWVSWAPFREKLDEAFDLFSKWGIKGIKMDFMNRDDQYMVDFYYKVCRKAAEYKIALDLHGAYKPTGWSRTFPHSSQGRPRIRSHCAIQAPSGSSPPHCHRTGLRKSSPDTAS